MNFAAVASLPLGPESRTWYRAVPPQFLPTALRTTHTNQIYSRFSPGPLGQPPFETLYLAENAMVALFETGALYGSPTHPGSVVPNPSRPLVIVNAQVSLKRVADLTLTLAQQLVATSAQELTGDWQGYQQRGPGTSVPQPIGLAPSQQLGEALKRDIRQIEGFRAVSAKVPYHMTLVVFPENLQAGSFVCFSYRDAAGVDQEVVIGSP